MVWQVAVGDTLMSVNGVTFPGPSGELAKDLAMLRQCSYPLNFEFMRRSEQVMSCTPLSSPPHPSVCYSSQEDGKVTTSIYNVTVESLTEPDDGKLGAVFGSGVDGRPVISRLPPTPGPAARCGLIRPGMVLHFIDKVEFTVAALRAPHPLLSGGRVW